MTENVKRMFAETNYDDASQGAGWSSPDLSIIQEQRRAPPFPMECLDDLAPWVSATAEGCSAPVDYVAITALVAASALLGNSRWVSPWDGWREPPVLWAALIGRPSSAKSPAADAVLRLIRELENELGAQFSPLLADFDRDVAVAHEARSNWQADVKAAVKNGSPAPELPDNAREPDRPERPRIVVSDATIEAMARILKAQPRGLLLMRDELSGWLDFDRYSSGSDRPFWLEAFGGRQYTVDRIKHGGEPLVIPNLSVAVIGGIQPDKMNALLLKGDDDGLAARALYSWPDPLRPQRPSRSADDGPVLHALRRLLHLRMGTNEYGDPIPVDVRFADDAADLFNDWRQANADKQDDSSGLFLSHLGKLPGVLARLSLVFEFLHWALSAAGKPEPETVSLRSVGLAAHIVDNYFVPMAERAFGDATLPMRERHAAAIAKKILKRRPKHLNTRDVARDWNIPGLRKAEDVRAAFSELLDAGWLKEPNSIGAAGRPRSDFPVNPLLFEIDGDAA